MGEAPRDAKTGLLELDDPTEDAGTERVASGESGIKTVAPPPSPATIIPAFNPQTYAEESEVRERMPTLTDDSALEQARLQSFPTAVPPPRRAMSTLPGPITASSRDSSVEIDTGESDLESLGDDEQIAILSVRLAPLTRVPALARELSQLGSLLADPKTAYVLGFVDGILPLETIIEVTGLPELETLRVLDQMSAQSIIVFKGP